MQFIGLDGSVRGRFAAGTGGLTQELEILRGDLSKLIYDRFVVLQQLQPHVYSLSYPSQS